METYNKIVDKYLQIIIKRFPTMPKEWARAHVQLFLAVDMKLANQISINAGEKVFFIVPSRSAEILKVHNSWFKYKTAKEIGYEIESVQVIMSNGKKKEKIILSQKRAHKPIFDFIETSFQDYKQFLDKDKMKKPPSIRAYWIRNGLSGPIVQQMLKTLKNKEQVYNYLELVITTVSTYGFVDVDVRKLLKNHVIFPPSKFA